MFFFNPGNVINTHAIRKMIIKENNRRIIFLQMRFCVRKRGDIAGIDVFLPQHAFQQITNIYFIIDNEGL